MGRIAKWGCLGVLGLVILVVALIVVGIVNAPKPQQQIGGASQADATAAPLGKVGQTASLRGWEITLLDFGPYERFAPDKPPVTKAQGRLVVADLRIKNLQTSTSNFTTNDFVLKSADGRSFQSAGQTATIDRGFLISQTVQPGLTTENRVVFDVDPAIKTFTFVGLGTQFEVAVP